MDSSNQIRAASPREQEPGRLSLAATATFDIEAAAGDGPPKRPTFAIKGYTGAVMNVAGFYSPVIVDLAGLKASSQQMPALLDHNPSQIVGQTSSVKIGADGVDFAGVVTGDNAYAQEVVSQARNGFNWQASIGANIDRREYLDVGKTAIVNGRNVSGPMVIAREATIYEISFVSIGADSQTSAAVAASTNLGQSHQGEIMDFDTWLEAKGWLDPMALDDNQRAALRAAYDAERTASRSASTGAAAPAEERTLDQIFAEAQRKRDREKQIKKLTSEAIHRCPGRLDDIRALSEAAINSQCSLNDFKLSLLELQLRFPSFSVSRSSRTGGMKAVEAAICMSGRLPDIEKRFDQDTLNAADEAYPHGLGLMDLLLMVARENGYIGHSDRDVDGILRAAFQRTPLAIRANDGFSTLSLPGILSNVANKFLMTGFNAVESSWRETSKIRAATDFKSMTTYALTGALEYEEVGAAGEIKHGTLGEVSYTNRVKTYAKMLAITYEDIRNDDLGALTEVPMRLGRGAALKLNKVFWTEFLADLSSFYTSGRGNISTGAGSALSSAGLTAALQKFRKQTDPDGSPLAIEPRILLVPPELEITADELMTSTAVNTGGGSTTDRVPSRNTWVSKFRRVVSTYLSNANIPNYSTTAWWLLADPMDLPVIEAAFLDGREVPVVESADADFNVLGIQMRGYHRFGVSKQEYRAAVRSAGV